MGFVLHTFDDFFENLAFSVLPKKLGISMKVKWSKDKLSAIKQKTKDHLPYKILKINSKNPSNSINFKLLHQITRFIQRYIYFLSLNAP